MIPLAYDGGEIRVADKASIRAFVDKHKAYLRGRVLDFGAGLSPYRDLVSGEYVPFNVAHPSTPLGSIVNEDASVLNCPFDAILCNQVLQYVLDVPGLLVLFSSLLKKNKGSLVMTYATTWPEIENTDKWRFTKVGLEFLLMKAGFQVVDHQPRVYLDFPGWKATIGYGVLAQMGESDG